MKLHTVINPPIPPRRNPALAFVDCREESHLLFFSPMSDEEPLLQPCPNCAALLDVSDEEPFAQVHCPMCGTAVRARTQFHNFELQSALGAGGVGTVYKARDVTLNRFVALKLLHKQFSKSPEHVAKFEMEAKITASINHPHVVKVYSFGEDHGIVYIAMELVEKGSLDDFMELQGRVAEAQVLEIGIQIAQGLQAANQVGLIHRDVKPGNILFADAHISKIVDFGLAVFMEQQAQDGEIWGTPYYVSPEVLNREPEDFRSDIYSLGGTLFHAAAGRPPFEAESASLVVLKHLKSQAVSLQAFAPDISSATAFVINRMLHKDREKRYASYDELIEHLSYARDKLLESASKPRQPKARVVSESETQQTIVIWLTLGLIALFISGGISAFIFRDRLFKKGEESSEVALHPPVKSAAQTYLEEYEEARKVLLGGDIVGAEQKFSSLAQRENAPQPLKNWSIFHAGLSALLDGALADAQSAFGTLQSAGMYSSDPADKRLANFFVESGRLITNKKPLPASVAKNFTKDFESMGLLVFALMDWQMSDFVNAGDLLAQYLAAKPGPDFAWVGEYGPLIENYVADAKAYKAVADKVQSADDAQKRGDALLAIQSLKGKLRVPGKMTEKLIEMELSVKNAMTTVVKVQETHDDAEWKALQPKIDALIRAWKFEEARSTIEASSVQSESVKPQKAALLKKVGWLCEFKKGLISNINSQGYPQAIIKRNRAPLPGPIKKASEVQVEMVTPYGSIPAAWTDIAPESVLAMADYFTKKIADSGADSAWLTGVYAFELGMEKEGRERLIKASQNKEQYRDELALFLEVSESR
jgi:serine/threonine protein kinase